MEQFDLTTHRKEEFIDITPQVSQVVKTKGWQQGLVVIYAPHTTAGITINEHADPTVKRDILFGLSQLVPDERLFQHTEGNSPAHFQASLVGSHKITIVENGRLVLGTWQGIFFCEFDGPRRRKVYLQFIAAG